MTSCYNPDNHFNNPLFIYLFNKFINAWYLYVPFMTCAVTNTFPYHANTSPATLEIFNYVLWWTDVHNGKTAVVLFRNLQIPSVDQEYDIIPIPFWTFRRADGYSVQVREDVDHYRDFQPIKYRSSFLDRQLPPDCHTDPQKPRFWIRRHMRLWTTQTVCLLSDEVLVW